MLYKLIGKEREKMKQYPIDPVLLRKRMAIPTLLAELSYLDKEVTIKYMRIWGEKRMPVSILYDNLVDELNKRN